jgi:hypothetical protein
MLVAWFILYPKRWIVWSDLPVRRIQEQMHLTYDAYDVGANGPVKYMHYLRQLKGNISFSPKVGPLAHTAHNYFIDGLLQALIVPHAFSTHTSSSSLPSR